jgi:hypothetical protein
MNDDSLSPVYNLRGCYFKQLNDTNIRSPYVSLFEEDEKGEKKKVYVNKDEFIFNGQYLDNTIGVFKNPSVNKDNSIQNHENKTIKP